MWEILYYTLVWGWLPITLVILTLIFLFRGNKYKGIKSIKGLWYRVNLHYNRKAPHELRNDLIHWEKGDEVILIDAYKEYGSWRDQKYTFKGFLEDSFIVAEKKKLTEVPAYKVAHYVNNKALDRMANKESIRLESRLKSSMYVQLLDTMREQNKEIEVQMRQLTK